MIDFKAKRTAFASGLRAYIDCLVIRKDQNEEMPDYPYVSYKITAPTNENKGTYQEHEDGISRKAYVTTISVTSHSNDYDEAVTLANKAREWVDYVGTLYLNENDIIVQSVGMVSDRSNFITSEYEYSQGFDFDMWLYDVVQMPNNGEIDEVNIENIEPIEKQDYEEIIAEADDLADEILVLQENYIRGVIE